MSDLMAALGRRIIAAGEVMAKRARRRDHEGCSAEEFATCAFGAVTLCAIGHSLARPKRDGLPRESGDVSQEVVSFSAVGDPKDAAGVVRRVVRDA